MSLGGRIALSGYAPPVNVQVQIVDRLSDQPAEIFGGVRFTQCTVTRVKNSYGTCVVQGPSPWGDEIGLVPLRAKKHYVRVTRDGIVEFVGPITSANIESGRINIRANGFTAWMQTKFLQSDVVVTPATEVDPDGFPDFTLDWSLGQEVFDYGGTGTPRYLHDIVNHIINEAHQLDDPSLRPPVGFQMNPTPQIEFSVAYPISINDEQLLSVQEQVENLVPDVAWAEVGLQALTQGDLRPAYDGDNVDDPGFTVTDLDFTESLSRGIIGPIVNEKLRSLESTLGNTFVLNETWAGLGQPNPSVKGNGGAETGIHQASYVEGEEGLTLTDIYGRRELGQLELSSGSRVGLPDCVPGLRLWYRSLDESEEFTCVGAPPRDGFEIEVVEVVIQINLGDRGVEESVRLTLIEG